MLQPIWRTTVTNSRKRVPIVGITTAASDKRFKQAEHRRERAAAKIAVAHGKDALPSREYGNPWHGEKDGKQYRPDDDRAKRK